MMDDVFLLQIRFTLDESGNIVDEVALYDNSTFIVNEGAQFPPSKTSRLSYSPNAGITLTNFNPTDEATIKTSVIFKSLDHSDSKTILKTKGSINVSIKLIV